MTALESERLAHLARLECAHLSTNPIFAAEIQSNDSSVQVRSVCSDKSVIDASGAATIMKSCSINCSGGVHLWNVGITNPVIVNAVLPGFLDVLATLAKRSTEDFRPNLFAGRH